jgi:3-dehydroquinate synthase
MKSIHVNLSQRSYDIEIGAGNLDRIAEFVAQRTPLSRAVIVTDTNVKQPHAMAVAESLADAGSDVELLIVEPGEHSKSVEAASQLWQELLQCATDRKTVVIAVGGGVIGDLAGFVAATFARGLAFVQVPTTLLAQVDSSVGGKVGVNLPGAKNIVGAFWQPLGVLIDIDVLKTLPQREYRAGLAEVVKYGVILDAEFFSYLEQQVDAINNRQADVLQYVIARCCRLKADVVEVDEREETGHRAVLNYGHTFCHAIEAVTGYDQFLHGEAVAIGMLCASRLAEVLGRVDRHFTRRQHALLSAFGLPVEMPEVDYDEVLAAMQHDKKVEHGSLRFVLPAAMGHVELVGGVEPQQARAALAS